MLINIDLFSVLKVSHAKPGLCKSHMKFTPRKKNRQLPDSYQMKYIFLMLRRGKAHINTRVCARAPITSLTICQVA